MGSNAATGRDGASVSVHDFLAVQTAARIGLDLHHEVVRAPTDSYLRGVRQSRLGGAYRDSQTANPTLCATTREVVRGSDSVLGAVPRRIRHPNHADWLRWVSRRTDRSAPGRHRGGRRV